MLIKTHLLFLNILLVLNCSSLVPSERVAYDFMEAYYVSADLQRAEQLASGLALEKIQSSVQLREGQTIDETTRRPEVSFKKIEGQVNGDEAVYLFLVTISPSDFQPIKKQSRLRIRLQEGVWKVTQFSDQDL